MYRIISIYIINVHVSYIGDIRIENETLFVTENNKIRDKN